MKIYCGAFWKMEKIHYFDDFSRNNKQDGRWTGKPGNYRKFSVTWRNREFFC